MITACANFFSFLLSIVFGGRGRLMEASHTRHRLLAGSRAISAPGRIELHRVSKTFESPDGPKVVLRNVSTVFEPGTFTVIFGPSGSGKSTLLKLIAGLECPDVFSGSIVVDGKSLTVGRARLREHLRSKVAVISQADALAPSMNLETNVGLGAIVKGASSRSALAHARVVLSQVGLEGHERKRPHQISGGQALRVAVARALAQDNVVILADEPDANLDGGTARQIFRLLRVAADSGQTVVVATHDDSAREFADRVLHVEDHRLIEEVPKPDCSAGLHRERTDTEYRGIGEGRDEVQHHRFVDRAMRFIEWAKTDYRLTPPPVVKTHMRNGSRLRIAWQHARHAWGTSFVLVAAAVLIASFPPLVTGGLARSLIDAVDRSIDQASIRRIIVHPTGGASRQVFDSEWINEWRNQPQIASVAGLIEVGVQVQTTDGESIYAVLEGVASDDPRFSAPPATALVGDEPMAVLPSGLAQRLGAIDGNGTVILTLQRFADGLRIERELPVRVVGTTDRSDGDRIYVAPEVADAVDSWLTDGSQGPTGRSAYRASVFVDRIEALPSVVARLEHAGFVTRHHLDEVGQVSAARTLVFGLANALSASFALAGAFGIALYALASARQNLRTTGVLRLLGARDRDVMLTLGFAPAVAAILGFFMATICAQLIVPKAQIVLEHALGGMTLTRADMFSATSLSWLLTVCVLTVGGVLSTSVLLTLRTCRTPILKALRAQA